MSNSNLSVFDKDKARLSFDRAAHRYDQSAKLQQMVARFLVDLVVTQKPQAQTILDLGCGTGQVTESMCQHYPGAEVIGLDFSQRMLHETQQRLSGRGYDAALVCADAERIPFADNYFDLMVSSLMLQWSNHLQHTLQRYHRALRADGRLFFSTFTEGTLVEVKSSWQHVDQTPHTSQFLSIEALKSTVEAAGFSRVNVISDTIIMTYSSVREMIMEIKQIGASNAHKQRERGLTGKQRFQAFEQAFEAFRQKDGQYPCTWQLAYVVCEH